MKNNQFRTANLMQHSPGILTIFLIYRLVLGMILLAIFFSNANHSGLGKDEPELFQWTVIFYTLFCFGSLFVFKAEQLINSVNRITFLLLIDIIALVLLIHASGGIQSGLGYLLVIMAAMCSIFVYGILALGLAAFITLFLLFETVYLTKGTSEFTSSIFSAGTLSTLVFATTLLFQYLTSKIRKTAAVAERRGKDVKNLQRMGENIVQRMQTGIIAFDINDKITLINQSALRMLDLPNDNQIYSKNVNDFTDLKKIVNDWRHNPAKGIALIRELIPGQEVRVNFAELPDSDGDTQTIIYIEDNRVITQQAQQLKLASLGRLTASIAHEIRNPLGAISHAAQLLNESPDLPTADARMTDIILQHSERVNQIIENTLSVSRRKEAKPESITLMTWLPKFIEEYQTSNEGTIKLIRLEANDDLKIKMDPIHLRQVLTNLFDNGLRYSKEHSDDSKIDVHIGYNQNRDKNFLEVIDYGAGVPDNQVEEIFEPFFTTAEKGSGLGLFISKELCEINQSNLHYEKTKQGLSCFRIEFSHYQRMV